MQVTQNFPKVRFSLQLVKLRQEAGFLSAYSFYHDNGGRRHFGFTYVHYLRIEKGAKLPKPHWLALFLAALRLTPGNTGCRELFLAYLKDLLQTDEAFDLIVKPLLAEPTSAATFLSREAFRWMKAEHAVHMTPEQFKVVVSDEVTYWCMEVLLNDRGAWRPQEVARVLGMGLKAVQDGLRRLKDCKLLREASRGRFASRLAGKFYTFPREFQDMSPRYDQVLRYWDRMHKRRGALLVERRELIRAGGDAMRNYARTLVEMVETSNTAATQTKGDGTGLFLIEASVKRLLPF